MDALRNRVADLLAAGAVSDKLLDVPGSPAVPSAVLTDTTRCFASLPDLRTVFPAEGRAVPGVLAAALEQDPSRRNRTADLAMLKAFRFLDDDQPFLTRDAAAVSMHGRYDRLLARQNRRWAQDTMQDGLELARKGKFKESLEVYKEAREIDPKFPDTFVAIGASNIKLGRVEDARAAFQQALRLDPSCSYAQRALAKLDEARR